MTESDGEAVRRRLERLERIVAQLELQMTLRTKPTSYEIDEAQRRWSKDPFVNHEHLRRKG